MPERKTTGLITQANGAFLCSKETHVHHQKPQY
jgi:hypothetical protein